MHACGGSAGALAAAAARRRSAASSVCRITSARALASRAAVSAASRARFAASSRSSRADMSATVSSIASISERSSIVASMLRTALAVARRTCRAPSMRRYVSKNARHSSSEIEPSRSIESSSAIISSACVAEERAQLADVQVARAVRVELVERAVDARLERLGRVERGVVARRARPAGRAPPSRRADGRDAALRRREVEHRQLADEALARARGRLGERDPLRRAARRGRGGLVALGAPLRAPRTARPLRAAGAALSTVRSRLSTVRSAACAPPCTRRRYEVEEGAPLGVAHGRVDLDRVELLEERLGRLAEVLLQLVEVDLARVVDVDVVEQLVDALEQLFAERHAGGGAAGSCGGGAFLDPGQTFPLL